MPDQSGILYQFSFQGDWTNSDWRLKALIHLSGTNDIELGFVNQKTRETMYLRKGESSNGVIVAKAPDTNGTFAIKYDPGKDK